MMVALDSECPIRTSGLHEPQLYDDGVRCVYCGQRIDEDEDQT